MRGSQLDRGFSQDGRDLLLPSYVPQLRRAAWDSLRPPHRQQDSHQTQVFSLGILERLLRPSSDGSSTISQGYV